MSIVLYIFLAILGIFLLLVLRKRLVVFEVKPINSVRYTIGFKEYFIPQLRHNIIPSKVSLRRFEDCKMASERIDGYFKTTYYLEDDGGIRVGLCRRDLRWVFWCVPKTIYYA